MEPLPVALGGAVAGWFLQGLCGPTTAVPAPACSCTCECPVRGDPQGWPWFVIISSGLVVIIGAVSLGFWLGSGQRGQQVTPRVETLYYHQKGKKGLGVLGKTLELTN